MASTEEIREQIAQYVRDAEKHLGLPENAIANSERDSDFVFVLKMCGVIEPLMKQAVTENVRRAIEHPKVATSGSEALLTAIRDLGPDRLRIILREFGAITEATSDFIQALFQIRNRYAHNIINAHLRVPELCTKIADEGGDPRLLNKLAGTENPSANALVRIFLKPLMYWNFGWFLRDALHLAKPPEPPPGGILGPFIEELQNKQNDAD